jgi:hypothetical protein
MRRLDPPTQERVRQALSRLAATGQGDVRRLQGLEEEYRLRVGDWRVRFRFEARIGALPPPLDPTEFTPDRAPPAEAAPAPPSADRRPWWRFW